jgi:hypothetical protein
MNRVLVNEDNLLRYGVDNELAQKAAENSLTLTKIRTLSIPDITSKFGMSEAEAKELKKCVSRAPIDTEIVGRLLSASNFICNVCKGVKGHAYIIHHINPYELTQDNSYENLIVLCPSDHDLAHRAGGLTLSIDKKQLIAEKLEWEEKVKILNAEMAARTIDLAAAAKVEVNDSEDKVTLRYLMYFIPFTSLASHIYYLPSSFDIDFLDVATHMETLMVDRPHGYPFSDPLLQKTYGEYLEKYYILYRMVVGETNGIPHFRSADDVRGRSISRRDRSNFTYHENENIDEALTSAKYEFESSYRNLILFLRQNYPDVKLDTYNES